MSIYRRLPRTNDEVSRAMELALRKAKIVNENEPESLAFSKQILERLVGLNPRYIVEVNERTNALKNQTTLTKEKFEVRDILVMYISHYLQSFNNAIVRGVYNSTVRNYYRIDTNDSTVPTLYNEAEIEKWSKQIINGEKEMVNAGGTPMSMPSAGEVGDVYKRYVDLDKDQSELKTKYDKEQEDVVKLLDEARFVVRNVWDEVEFAYRYEDAASKRRKCREYGVVYISDNGEEIEEEA